MWDELAERSSEEMVDLVHRSGSKSLMLGMYHLFLGVILVGISIGIYFKLPIQGEGNLVLPVIISIFLTYPLLMSSAYWLQAESIPELFVRSGSEGLWLSIPERREFLLFPVPGYRVREELIPWYSIRDITYHNYLFNLVAVRAGATIHKINGEDIEISTLYFSESVAHLRAKLDRVRDEYSTRGKPAAGSTGIVGHGVPEARLVPLDEVGDSGAADFVPTSEAVGYGIEVKLTKSSWMRRVFRITTRFGVHKVEWNGLRTGSDSWPVIVNRETQNLPYTQTPQGRRYEFRLKDITGYIFIRTSIFMTLRSVKLEVAGKLFYEEG